MIWWDWPRVWKLSFVAAMVFVSSVVVMTIASRSSPAWPPRAIVGGISVLTIPQIVAWQMFVGLRTGEILQYSRRVSRADRPIDFWLTLAAYGLLLSIFLGGCAFMFAVASRIHG